MMSMCLCSAGLGALACVTGASKRSRWRRYGERVIANIDMGIFTTIVVFSLVVSNWFINFVVMVSSIVFLPVFYLIHSIFVFLKDGISQAKSVFSNAVIRPLGMFIGKLYSDPNYGGLAGSIVTMFLFSQIRKRWNDISFFSKSTQFIISLWSITSESLSWIAVSVIEPSVQFVIATMSAVLRFFEFEGGWRPGLESVAQGTVFGDPQFAMRVYVCIFCIRWEG